MVGAQDPVERRRRRKRSASKPKVKELQPELSKVFGEVLSPLIREFAGSEKPWFALTVQNVKMLLASAVGQASADKFDIADESDPLMKLVRDPVSCGSTY